MKAETTTLKRVNLLELILKCDDGSIRLIKSLEQVKQKYLVDAILMTLLNEG